MTAYFLLFVGFVLALFGTFFKSTETDDKGATVRTARGFPVLTRIGKAAAALLTVSLLVSFYITRDSSKENEIAKSNLKAELERVQQQNERLHANIRRTLDPIRDVAISFDLSLPLTHPALQAYRTRLEDGARQGLKELKLHYVPKQRFDEVERDVQGTGPNVPLDSYGGLDAVRQNYDVYISFRNEQGRPLRVGVLARSRLFPKIQAEPIPYFALASIQVDVHLYKKPIDFARDRWRLCCPDLTIPAYVSLDAGLRAKSEADIKGKEGLLSYDLDTREATVTGSYLKVDPAYWKNSNGEITSVQDLSGTQIVIRIGAAPLQPTQADVRKSVHEIHRIFTLNYLGITMSGGRNFNFDRDDLTRYSDDAGATFFATTIPR